MLPGYTKHSTNRKQIHDNNGGLQHQYIKMFENPTRNKDRDEFSNVLSSFSYQQLINKPTRFSKTHSTLIDNIYTNYPLDSEVCTLGIVLYCIVL